MPTASVSTRRPTPTRPADPIALAAPTAKMEEFTTSRLVNMLAALSILTPNNITCFLICVSALSFLAVERGLE